VFCAG